MYYLVQALNNEHADLGFVNMAEYTDKGTAMKHADRLENVYDRVRVVKRAKSTPIGDDDYSTHNFGEPSF